MKVYAIRYGDQWLRRLSPPAKYPTNAAIRDEAIAEFAWNLREQDEFGIVREFEREAMFGELDGALTFTSLKAAEGVERLLHWRERAYAYPVEIEKIDR